MRRQLQKKPVICERCGLDVGSGKKYSVEVSGFWFGSHSSWVCEACYLANEKRLEHAMKKTTFVVHSGKTCQSLTLSAKDALAKKKVQEKLKKATKVAKRKEQARLDKLDETKLPVI